MKQYTQIMFTSINHELRTPINAIQNSLACMKYSMDPSVQMYFEICESSSSFLLSLVNDTLDFAQLQAGKFKMNYEKVDLHELAGEVHELIGVQLRLKSDVELVKDITRDCPQFIRSDYQRLKQIMINLLRNSTKFTFSGFIKLSLRRSKLAIIKKGVVISVVDACVIEVYDTGIGISEENQANLFKLFGKVTQKNKSVNKEGIGLGLYITKELVQALGGFITVNSEENVYTSFQAYLPLSRYAILDQELINNLSLKNIGLQTSPVENLEELVEDELSISHTTDLQQVDLEEISELEFEVLPKEATAEDFALLSKDDPIFAQMVEELAEIQKLKEEEELEMIVERFSNRNEENEENESYWSEESGESELSEERLNSSSISGENTPLSYINIAKKRSSYQLQQKNVNETPELFLDDYSERDLEVVEGSKASKLLTKSSDLKREIEYQNTSDQTVLTN